jgi:hypothetical protein
MRITIETRAKMAFVHVVDDIGTGGVARSEPLNLEKHLVRLCWNTDEQRVGVEIGLAALPPEARAIADDVT